MPFAAARSYALLSIGAAVATIALKLLAWWLTGSVGLLSDALEGTINLVGALVALIMIGIAARPPDEDHSYGYTKAEYFASGVEGMLILVAAIAIAIAAIDRLITPRALEQVGLGIAISVAASLINFAVAQRLFTAGRDYRSVALEADARHLITDVWTSAGVVAGVAAVWLTGWERLDPLIALAVAANIVRSGYKIMQHAALGLLDRAVPEEQLQALNRVLDRYRTQGIDFHALRTRQAGARSFVSVHVLVPPDWSVSQGHDLAHQVERDMLEVLPGAGVLTHVEPLGDPESYRDMGLDPDERAK